MGLALLLLSTCNAKPTPGPTPTPTFAPTPTLILGIIQEDDALQDKLQDLKTRNPVLSSLVNEFVIKYQTEGYAATVEWAREQQLLDAEDNLPLTVMLDTQDATIIQDFITQAEAHEAIVLGYLGNEIEVLIPQAVIEDYVTSEESESLLDELAALDHVQNIKITTYMMPLGNIESEGVHVIGADQWHTQGYHGQGVKVGVLDYGFDGYRDLLGTDLPTTIVAKSFARFSGVDDAGTPHGTAVGEIIYDLAPNAALYFACIDGTASSFANGARWLADQGVDIINHSGGYPFGPFDGTNARDELVGDITARDILWLNAAGNDGSAHWRGMFADTDGDGFHNFGPDLNRIPLWGERGVQLHWWNNPGEDYDLYVYNWLGVPIAMSVDDQKHNALPMEETMRFPVIEGFTYYAAIKAEQNAQAVMLDLFVSNGQITDLKYVERERSITNPGTAKTSLSVGATIWSDDEIAIYSSGGPTGDGRLKPEISAPAEVQNVSYADYGFSGTSAATPHIAGAAALILSAYPAMSSHELQTYLQDHALDLGASGADNVYGHGRVQLPDQNEIADPIDASPTPEASPSLTPTPTATPEVNGLLPTVGALLSTKVLPSAEDLVTKVAPTVETLITDIAPTIIGQVEKLEPTLRSVAGTLMPDIVGEEEPEKEDNIWIIVIIIAVIVLILALVIMWLIFKQPQTPPSAPHVASTIAPTHSPTPVKRLGPPTVQAPVLYLVAHNGQRYPLIAGFNTIGRASTCTVHVADTEMSRQHARLRVSAHEVIVEDISTNGTFINTRRIAGPTRLTPQDQFRCGQTTFTLLGSGQSAIQPQLVASRPQAFLQIVEQGQIPLIEKNVYTIGRSSQSDITLRDEKVSRQHSRLEWQNGRLILIDQRSSGGTWVNGQRITQCWLQSGDRIQVGNTILTLIL